MDSVHPQLNWTFGDLIVELNRWVASERVETGQQVLEPFKSPFHLGESSSVSHESRSRCEIKLWLWWFEVQVRACCAARLSEGSLRGWIDCWSCMDGKALASLHNHLIVRRVKLGDSTYPEAEIHKQELKEIISSKESNINCFSDLYLAVGLKVWH